MPEKIYLIEYGEEVIWSNKPCPSGDEHPEHVTEYIRADVIEALQAKLDLIMLEHCPDEMTKDQLDN